MALPPNRAKESWGTKTAYLQASCCLTPRVRQAMAYQHFHAADCEA